MSAVVTSDSRNEIVRSGDAFDKMPIRQSSYTERLRCYLEESPIGIRNRDFILAKASAVQIAVKRALRPSATTAALTELCEKVEAFEEAVIKALPLAGKVSEQLQSFINYFPNEYTREFVMHGALSAIAKAAERGIPYAQFRFAEHLIAQSALLRDVAASRNYSMAEQWLKKAADQGHVQSNYLLGLFYHGHNSSVIAQIPHRNLALALQHMERAASNGHMAAQYNMGIFCKNGVDGVEMAPDLNAAFEWFRRSAMQGFSSAQNALGKCYLNGWGVKSDPVSAIKWFKLAALQGHADAMCNLGECLVKGMSGNSARSEGLEWLHKAAKRDHVRAHVVIGECYLNGVGVKRNPAEAIRFLRYATVFNNPTACRFLAECYKDGTGIEKDPSASELYNRLAAECEQTSSAMRKQIPYIIIDDHRAK